MPHTSPRAPYTTDTLLDVAVRVFNERGYDGTSMEHLATAMGITKSSIYHHVRGKEHLLRLALGRATDALFAVLDEPGARVGSARDRFEHVVRRTTETLIAELPYVTLLLRVRGNTPTEQWALRRRREFDRRVAELVALALKEDADKDAEEDAGELPRSAVHPGSIDPRLSTRLVFGMINSIVEWYRPGTRDDARATRELVTQVTRFALAGLGLPAAAAGPGQAGYPG